MNTVKFTSLTFPGTAEVTTATAELSDNQCILGTDVFLLAVLTTWSVTLADKFAWTNLENAQDVCTVTLSEDKTTVTLTSGDETWSATPRNPVTAARFFDKCKFGLECSNATEEGVLDVSERFAEVSARYEDGKKWPMRMDALEESIRI